MRKTTTLIATILLALAMAFTITACGGGSSNNVGSDTSERTPPSETNTDISQSTPESVQDSEVSSEDALETTPVTPSVGNKIVSVYTAGALFVGLKADGTVVGAGGGSRTNVGGWRDIVSIYLTPAGTWGVKSDGTVIYTGELTDSINLDEIAKWTDIVSTNGRFGLKSDGTIVGVWYEGYQWHEADISFANSLTNVIALDGPFAIRADGSVAFISPGSSHILSDFSDIIAIAYNGYSGQSQIGLRADGTVVSFGKFGNDPSATPQPAPPPGSELGLSPVHQSFYPVRGHQELFDEWHDIIKIAIDNRGIYGLKSDGTIMSTRAGEVSTWTNIVDISAGEFGSIIGLKSDGSVVVETSDISGASPATIEEVLNW